MEQEFKTVEPISLDFYNNNIITITAKQLDSDSRYLKISCTEHGKFFHVNKDTMTVIVRWNKPDGLYVLNDCTVSDDGTVLLLLTAQMLAVAGRCKADLMLLNISLDEYKNSNIVEIEDITEANIPVLSTMTFYGNILSTPVDYSDIESMTEYNALTNLVGQCSAIVASENERVEAENQRQQDTATAIKNCEEATANANVSAENANTVANNVQSAVDNANLAAENANNATTKAEIATQEANTATQSTNTATQSANEAANNANNATELANIATENANIATTNANNAANEANIATQETNTAINDANIATENANNAASYADVSASNANAATTDCIDATNEARTATQSANEAAEECRSVVAGTGIATTSDLTNLENRLQEQINALPKVYYGDSEPNASLGKDGDIYMLVIGDSTETVGE